jgi:serine/threonine protein phosphatase PrpC
LSTNLNVAAHSSTHAGRKRKNNEDAFLVDGDIGVYVVADGMGGQNAGEVASNRAVQVFRERIAAGASVLRRLSDDPSQENRAAGQALVEKAIQSACADVFKLAVSDPKLRGMGTTLTSIVVAGAAGIVGNVGDSRVYLVRAGRAYKLTEDHTLVAAQVKSGSMTKEEAQRSPLRNVLTRAVGNQESVQVDTLLVDLMPGDRILLCSDGLHGYVPEDEEMARLVSEGDAAELPARLVDLANDRGGKDNTTAIVLDISGEDAQPEEFEASTKLDVLRQIPLFTHLTYKEQAAVLGVAELRTYGPGDDIVVEGEPGGDLYLILRGKVSVYKGDAPVATLLTGSHFGEMGLVDEGRRSATVRAVAPTRVMIIRKTELMNLMRRESVLAVKLLWAFVQVLSQRLRQTNAELSEALQELTTAVVETKDDDDAPFSEG